jgi:hypothetical protein
VPHRPEDTGKGVDQVSGPRGEIYVEYKQVGQIMKVTAIDADTGLEAVIMGPASTAQTQLQKIAVQKLKMLLKKAEGKAEDSDDDFEGTTSKGWTA